jgi:penicillin amidase
MPSMDGFSGGAPPLDEPRLPLGATGDLSGSNNWAVAGSKTASGKPILCSDPHQPFWLPSSWYEFGLHGPEDDAVGAGHPGVPGLWWGSNGQIAWGITNNGASTRDLYVEQAHPDDPSLYRDGDGWAHFEEREALIAVRGEDPRRVTLRATVRGPIMNDVLPPVDDRGDPPLSLRWVGQEHLEEQRSLTLISRARTWEEFRAALAGWSVPIFNFGYADRDGFVGYQCAGRVPIRGRVKHGYREAGNPEDAWRGTIPFDALPRLENPERGWVASANNLAAPDDYPYPLYGAFAAGYRMLRIKEALEEPRPFDRERAQRLLADVKGTRPARLVPEIVRRLGNREEPEARLLVELLSGWDGRYALESAAPAVFEMFMRAWQLRVARERFPERLAAMVAGQGGVAARLLAGEDLGWFDGDGETALAESAVAAIAQLRSRHGDDPAGWTWGTIHQAHWRHPLSNAATADAFDVGPAPVAGAGDTLCNTGLGVPPEFTANGGVEYRLLVDFAEPDRIWTVQNVGNSGMPESDHYRDQFPAWLAGELREVSLARDGVGTKMAGKVVLEPAG